MKTYKLFIYLLLGAMTFGASSCIEPDDLITANATAGGKIEAPSVVPWKGVPVTINFKVYKGTPVQKVNVYKSFTHNADTATSDEVFLTSIDINEENAQDFVEKSFTVTWEQLVENIPTLPKGYVVPTDPDNAEIGDYFTLSLKALRNDGREVIGAQTLISIANFFAGDYTAHLIYRHPAYGTYPDNIYVEEDNDKTLLAVNSKTCVTSFATWGPAEKIYITIDPDNNYAISISVENWSYDVQLGDPHDPTKVSNYDPETGKLELYYSYMGSGGYRVFWETFTLKE